MRDWITKEIRETKHGTMTDMRLFDCFGRMGGGGMGDASGTNGFCGMMGNQ